MRDLIDGVFNKKWFVHKAMEVAALTSFQKYASGKLLDIGCGEKSYAAMTKPYVTEHLGLDYQHPLHDKSKIDLFGTVYEIPEKISILM